VSAFSMFFEVKPALDMSGVFLLSCVQRGTVTVFIE
jgi:hypothetical protein